MSHAQKYRAFDTTLTWHTIRTGSANFGEYCSKDHAYNYYTKGYTINNNRIWHKLHANIILHFYIGAAKSDCDMKGRDSTAFIGYYYNDTLNKKVYFLHADSLTPNFTPVSRHILFDFDKNINDVFDIGPGLSYKVTSIDSILFDNKYHKRYNCRTMIDFNYSPNTAYVIEGIGSSVGVFNSRFYIFSSISTPVVCFTNTGTTKYFARSAGIQNSATAIRDTSLCPFKTTQPLKIMEEDNLTGIYPIPCNDKLMVELNDNSIVSFSYFIYNVYGALIKSNTLVNTKKNTSIDVKELPEGTYTLVIKDNKNQEQTKKFIVLRK
ncbi:MAG: T9SS type A sorting domain-containing protein [Bacteroidia bacterium]|nr:T9SS type A sorting domain-containing protein [Bacteroidia bacterium]